MPSEIASNIEYIEHLFMHVADDFKPNEPIEALILSLNQKSITYTSIAYEAASMAFAFDLLKQHQSLENWLTFYLKSAPIHQIHMQIGLGWAFAKADLWPNLTQPIFTDTNHVSTQWIYDGIGYYFALFKGRNTLKFKQYPAELNAIQKTYFDNGIGRRLWYMSKGDDINLVERIDAFEASRRGNIWKGVGLACRYVLINNHAYVEPFREQAKAHINKFDEGFNINLFER